MVTVGLDQRNDFRSRRASTGISDVRAPFWLALASQINSAWPSLRRSIQIAMSVDKRWGDTLSQYVWPRDVSWGYRNGDQGYPMGPYTWDDFRVAFTFITVFFGHS